MFFPYLFCTDANKYVSRDTLPLFDDYIPQSMKPEKYVIFQKWYSANFNTPFCLQKELAEYCHNDTLILLKAVIRMREILLNITGKYDVLPKAMSIAGVAMAVYRA